MQKLNRHDQLFIMHNALQGTTRFDQQGRQKGGSTISLIGIRDVFNQEIPFYRRFIWTLCIAICVLLVVYYVSSRMGLMLSRPTQVAVTLKHNSSMRLPDVTLCPLWLTPHWNNLSDKTSYISGSSVNYENTLARWKPTETTLGSCMAHRHDAEVEASGLSFGMLVRVNWSRLPESVEGIRVLLHERKDVPLPHVEGMGIPRGQHVSIAIRLKGFQSLSRKNIPCEKDPLYSRSSCVHSCFDSHLLSLINCRLPFMTNGSSECTGDESSKSFQGVVGNATVWSDCGSRCIMECSRLMYTPYVESVGVASTLSTFTFYFPEMWYEIVEQKESYDLIALLCDIGGTCGLFLGCSLLTLVQLLDLIPRLSAFSRTTPLTSDTTSPNTFK